MLLPPHFPHASYHLTQGTATVVTTKPQHLGGGKEKDQELRVIPGSTVSLRLAWVTLRPFIKNKTKLYRKDMHRLSVDTVWFYKGLEHSRCLCLRGFGTNLPRTSRDKTVQYLNTHAWMHSPIYQPIHACIYLDLLKMEFMISYMLNKPATIELYLQL